MVGILSWIVAGAVAVALARLAPHRRQKLLKEGLAGGAAGLAAGFLATAMDFGGTSVLDVRAVAFAALTAAAAVALLRLFARRSTA